MKFTLITVVYNGEKYIEDCLRSVLRQDYPDLEYIVVDGGSKDGTMDIINRYRDEINKVISGPDKGIYDAMNKGLAAATGEVVGFMNADDYFAGDTIVSKVAAAMQQHGTDAVIGNVIYVPADDPNKVVRYFSSKGWKPQHMLRGEMPPHLSFYVKREVYNRLGFYKIDYKISADFELILRYLYVNKVSWVRIPDTMVVMRMGGVSSEGIKSVLTINKEILRACRENGVKTNMLRIYSKYFKKIFQFVSKPKPS